MLNIERLDYILKELQQNKAVYVDQLARKYYVSKSTIRRDLAELEKQGLLRRSYGGAMLSDAESNETPFALRKMENHAAKDTIASMAARIAKDDMFIALDSSSTVMHMIRYLAPRSNLRILTTSAQTALDALDMTSAQVYCTGGWMHSYSRGFIGEAARQSIVGFNTDILFFSARAISLENGITDINEEEIALRLWMLKKCRISVLLCDSTKFDQSSFKSVCEIDQINFLVTDSRPDDRWMDALEKAKVKVIYPGMKLTKC